jgi:hypothetical protein
MEENMTRDSTGSLSVIKQLFNDPDIIEYPRQYVGHFCEKCSLISGTVLPTKHVVAL